MKRWIVAVAVLAATVGAPARADFVNGKTSLPPTKANLRALPAGVNANFYFQASDYNALMTAALDLRSQITSGVFLGLSLQAGDPNPLTLYPTTNYLWLDPASALHFTLAGTPAKDNLVAFGPVTTKGDLLAFDGSGFARVAAGSNGTFLVADSGQSAGVGWASAVTSVGLSMPSTFSVSNSPLLSSGTISVSYNSQSANLVLAGPSTGSPSAPTFRSLVSADLPTIGVAQGGTGLTSFSTGDLLYANTPTSLSRLPANGSSTNKFLTQTLGGAPSWATIGASDVPPMLGATTIADGLGGGVPQPHISDRLSFLRGDGSWVAGNAGTVTSVALSMPGTFNISGSPITSSGTLSVSYTTQNANQFLAGPTTGSPGTPSFRTLVAADLPSSTVTAGTYSNATITVDSHGVVTSASNGAGGVTTLATAYSNGTSSTDATVSLSSFEGGVQIRDNAAPITGSLLTVSNSGASTKYLDVKSDGVHATHLIGSSGTPLCAAGTAAAGGSTCTVSGTDLGGIVTLTGNTTGAGTIFVVTFSGGYAFASAPSVVCTPRESQAAALSYSGKWYVDSTTTSYTMHADQGSITGSASWNCHVDG